jgi:hypothetical protein
MKTIKNVIATMLLLIFANFTFASVKTPSIKKSFENRITDFLNLSSISKNQETGSKVAIKVRLIDGKLEILETSGNNKELENYVVEKLKDADVNKMQFFTDLSFVIKINLK